MRSHRRHNRFNVRTAAPVILVLVVLATGVAFMATDTPVPGSGIAVSITRPVTELSATVTASAGTFFELLNSKRALVEEKRALERQLAARARKDELIALLERENKELKERLGRSTGDDIVLGVVLSRPNVSLYDTLVIDVGSADGVAVDDVVRAEGGVVIGTVARTTTHTAVVSLFSTPGRETDVQIGTAGTTATARGQGGGTFAVELPKSVAVAEGDPVVLPSITPTIFGVVEAIIERPADPIRTILFSLPVNMHELRHVEVVQSGD